MDEIMSPTLKMEMFIPGDNQMLSLLEELTQTPPNNLRIWISYNTMVQ